MLLAAGWDGREQEQVCETAKPPQLMIRTKDGVLETEFLAGWSESQGTPWAVGQSPGLGQPWVLSARHPSWGLLGSEEFVGVENPCIWCQEGRHE